MIDSLKKYLWISLGIHLFIIIILLISNGSSIKQPFIVFGAYSKKNYHTFYKNNRLNVPFLSQHTARSARVSGTGKHGSGKHGMGKSGTGKHGKHSLGKKSGKHSRKSHSGKSSSSKKKSKNLSAIKKLQEKIAREQEKAFEKELRKIELETQQEIDKEIKDRAKKEKQKKDRLAAEKKRESEEQEAREKLAKEAAELERLEAEQLEDERFKKEQLETEKLKQSEKEKEAEAQVPELPQEEQAEMDDTSSTSSDALNTDDNELDEDDGGPIQEEYLFTLSGSQEQTKYSRHIQSEIERLWRPPLGVPKGTTCKVKFTVSSDGKIKDFETVKKSNILIYDLSILRVAHRFKFNKYLWGKCFVIDFRQ